MAYSAEAETGTIFLNGHQSVPIRTNLIEMVHPQPSTPIKTDNATSHSILTGDILRKRSKFFDVCFNWM